MKQDFVEFVLSKVRDLKHEERLQENESKDCTHYNCSNLITDNSLRGNRGKITFLKLRISPQDWSAVWQLHAT